MRIYRTVKCPYCKGKQEIDLDIEAYEKGNKYWDCQHCLECFEIVVKVTAKQTPPEEDKPL